MATTTKTVDFAPEYGISGDYRKITEYDFAAINARLVPVITILLMEQGSNQLFPGMGARNILMQMPFSERGDVESIVSEVQNQLDRYSACACVVRIDDSKSDWISGEVYLGIEVDGVPGTLTLGANRDSVKEMQPFKISHPSIFVG